MRLRTPEEQWAMLKSHHEKYLCQQILFSITCVVLLLPLCILFIVWHMPESAYVIRSIIVVCGANAVSWIKV